MSEFRFNSRKPRYNDDSDYTTNAPSYYDDLARKNQLIKYLAKKIWEYEKTLNESLENIEKVLNEYIDFNQSLGLPTTLADLHLEKATYDDFLKVGQQATIPTETIHQMPFDVTAEDVANAIMTVDSYVRNRK